MRKELTDEETLRKLLNDAADTLLMYALGDVNVKQDGKALMSIFEGAAKLQTVLDARKRQ